MADEIPFKDETIINSPVYLQLSQEFFSHKKLLDEAYLSDKFKFTDLIINPEKYMELCNSPEICSYLFHDMNTPDLFMGIEVHISPLVETWKWVCDFK